jgi:hypothetical protein
MLGGGCRTAPSLLSPHVVEIQSVTEIQRAVGKCYPSTHGSTSQAARYRKDRTCIVMAIITEKRSAAGSSNPLHEVCVLQQVLSYVGPGHHLFVAPVSKGWNEVYATVDSLKPTAYDERFLEDIVFSTGPELTFCSSAFASPSRVKLALECGLECETQKCQLAAGKHADAATLAAARRLGMTYTPTIMHGAMQSDKLAEVQFLHAQGCPWPLGVIEVAASCGHYELVRWCLEHGCPWRPVADAPCYAAKSGNVELMAWVLQQPGTQLSAEVFSIAASKNHKTMCKFLYAQQCPWDANSTSSAARSGHVKLLHSLMHNGCPWDARELSMSAAEGGSVKVLIYLQQQGVLRGVPILTLLLSRAGAFSKLAAAKWIREQGAEWPTVLRHSRWSDEVLEWAVAEGFTLPTN